MHTRTLALSLIAVSLLSLSSVVHPRDTSRRKASQTLAGFASVNTARVPAPEDVLGFRPGDDRKLASWNQVVDYFRKLDAASDRLKFEVLGQTTMGVPFAMATISAPENLAHLDQFREIQRQLADPRTLGPNPDPKAEQLIARGKTIVLITCGIHSTEVGSYLSGMLIAHRLASSDEPEIKSILQNCIILLVPSLNPDGVDIVKNWYDKTLGTPYEGTDPPMLYHKYTGHDNNRDWYAFTQAETQLTVDKIHNVWHPQIVHDIHQQGEYGARLFLPPYMQPVEPNVPEQIVAGYTELGLSIEKEMRAAGFKGITWDSTYDAWTPSRAYSHYHGGVRILSETASARLASPLAVKATDLGSREGYDARVASPNYPEPWLGGEWRLRDITNYMTTAAFALLRHASQNRARWLHRFYAIGKEAVRPRRPGELSAFLIPPSDNQSALLNILERGGVEFETAKQFTIKGESYPDGTVVVRMDQPYGGFAKALLETQHYPDLRDASHNPIAPYDVTAHTLSLLMGVPVKAVFSPFKFTKPRPEVGRGWNGGCGDAHPPIRALYRSHIPAIDEGWTRWVLEHQSKCLYYSSLEDAEIRAGNLRAKYETIIIPDQSPRAILNGYRPGTMPPELTGGIGPEGVRALREFVEQGGRLVCLNRASDFAIEQFKLPVRDVTQGLKRTEYYAPGSILRTELDTSHPVATGMQKESIAWVEDSPAFEISNQSEARRVSIIARYPAGFNPLLSGWLLGDAHIRGKAALLEVTLGRGRIYLFGFRPQYRGQSLATYPLFFNAIR